MSDPHAPGSCEPGVHLTLYGCPLCSLPVHLKCKLQELGIGTVGCRMSLLRSVASGALRLFSFFSVVGWLQMTSLFLPAVVNLVALML